MVDLRAVVQSLINVFSEDQTDGPVVLQSVPIQRRDELAQAEFMRPTRRVAKRQPRSICTSLKDLGEL